MTTHDDLQTSDTTNPPGADVGDLATRVIRIRVDGRLDVTGPDGLAMLGAEDLPERELRALAATADPMSLPELAGILAGADTRGHRAAGAAMEDVLAAYTQDVSDYRGVASAAATIVRFALQAEPLKRAALQDEVAAVLGLEAAVEPGGALHAQRVWMDGLLVFTHYLQLRAPYQFADEADADCACLAHLTLRANDPALASAIVGADPALAASLEGTGLVLMPLGVGEYLTHRQTCPRAVAEGVDCSCGLAALMAHGQA